MSQKCIREYSIVPSDPAVKMILRVSCVRCADAWHCYALCTFPVENDSRGVAWRRMRLVQTLRGSLSYNIWSKHTRTHILSLRAAHQQQQPTLKNDAAPVIFMFGRSVVARVRLQRKKTLCDEPESSPFSTAQSFANCNKMNAHKIREHVCVCFNMLRKHIRTGYVRSAPLESNSKWICRTKLPWADDGAAATRKRAQMWWVGCQFSCSVRKLLLMFSVS